MVFHRVKIALRHGLSTTRQLQQLQLGVWPSFAQICPFERSPSRRVRRCLTTIQDLPEEGEVQSFRIKNDTVLILVAADIVDMYMSITKQFVLSTVDEYLLARVEKHTPGTPGRKAAEAFRSTYMQQSHALLLQDVHRSFG